MSAPHPRCVQVSPNSGKPTSQTVVANVLIHTVSVTALRSWWMLCNSSILESVQSPKHACYPRVCHIFVSLKSSTTQKSNFSVFPVSLPPHPALAMLNVVGELREEVMMSSTASQSINIALWGKGPEAARSEVTFLESWKHILYTALLLFHLVLYVCAVCSFPAQLRPQ